MKKIKRIFKLPICYSSEKWNTQFVIQGGVEIPDLLYPNTGFVM